MNKSLDIELVEKAFQESSYSSENNTVKRNLLDRLTFGSRIGFHFGFLSIVYRCGKCSSEGRLDRYEWMRYGIECLRLAESCKGIFRITGMDNISSVKGPVVFIGNHMSLLETITLPGIILPRKNITFIVKKSLADLPYFGDIMKATNAICIGRSKPREDFRVVINEGKQHLADGRSVVIFPQSTRSAEFQPSKFNSIGVKLAKKADVPVVPFALKTDFLGNGKIFKDFGPVNKNNKIYFHFGKAFKIDSTSREAHNFIVDFIQKKLGEWNNLQV